ncbi:MAG: 6-phosphofructokinase [Lachnospiraceae bacterium]|nr:6-phosphofructokinase [Lachnospiraceae bacterium]
MARKQQTIGVLTSGGDAPGMNAAIRAVVRTAVDLGHKVKGIRRGFTGLIEEDFIDMDAMSVSDIISRGGTILYTSRSKEFMTPEGQAKAADNCRKHGIDGVVVIGGDGSFRGAEKLAEQGIRTVAVPGTIDLDIACTEYTIGFDTAINTAMEAADKLRDTSGSHERCNVIEVMGRTAGHLALWCAIANGSEYVLLPEKFNDDEMDKLVAKVKSKHDIGKKHHIVVNAEGVGDSFEIAKYIQEHTGIETRATVIGHIQRGGSPTCRDRVYASALASRAVDLLDQGQTCRVVAFRHGHFTDYSIAEAMSMQKTIDPVLDKLIHKLSR